ncbi:hypothetical protein CAPTEDRAFT_217999 [Capitella teleta]|uniref:Uncharacterized protein n=1 Tax=Capitella teleta TaxID=283909 RepID=R7UI57_CAPTE|nr:hypothetical protein CAPTEDRAFT_217999 [Capitella teleta]|eukprot:ELU03463.1 hypothetical protein CAPTEDRAFT_217999 [Capitella teleta]
MPTTRKDSVDVATFTKAELDSLVKECVNAAVKVATDAFNKRLQAQEKEIQTYSSLVQTREMELETALKANRNSLANLNRLEQYSRRAHLRISGVKMERRDDCKQVVADFLSQKLETKEKGRINVSSQDLDVAHTLPTRPLSPEESASGKERIPKVIVRFFSRELRDAVMQCRRSLKNTGCSLQDDLMTRNYSLVQSLKKCPKLESVWTWNGKVFAKEKGESRGRVFDINDPLPL